MNAKVSEIEEEDGQHEDPLSWWDVWVKANNDLKKYAYEKPGPFVGIIAAILVGIFMITMSIITII